MNCDIAACLLRVQYKTRTDTPVRHRLQNGSLRYRRKHHLVMVQGGVTDLALVLEKAACILACPLSFLQVEYGPACELLRTFLRYHVLVFLGAISVRQRIVLGHQYLVD